jgi:hypothetical protein
VPESERPAAIEPGVPRLSGLSCQGSLLPSPRDVDLQPELRDELLAWRAATPFADPDALVFPTSRGSAQNRHNVRQRVVLPAAERANERLAEQGHALLPDGLSPHALRRSFASWLFVEGEDVPYVQQQMGHEDPTITLAIYAQVVRHGRTSARSRRREQALADRALTGTGGPEGSAEAILGAAAERKNPAGAGPFEEPTPGLEPGTPSLRVTSRLGT